MTRAAAQLVRSASGDVELVPARGRSVVVRETQHYTLEEPTLERDVEGGVLTLETRCEATFVTCVSDLRVSVPRGEYAVSAETDSGDVKVGGISRNDRAARSIEARADSGDVTVDGR